MSSVGEVTPDRRQYRQLDICAREANIPIYVVGQLIAELLVAALLP